MTVEKKKPKPPKADALDPLPPLWSLYRVELEFLTDLCASVPANPELIRAWTEAMRPAAMPIGGKTLDEINEEVLATLAEPIAEPQFSMLVFQKVKGICSQRAGTMRAHYKDCARVLSAQFMKGRIPGERAFSTKVINGVYLDEREYWLPILRPDGTPVTQADGTRDKPVHARGPRGPIDALKRFEYIAPPSVLRFTLKVLGTSVGLDDLTRLFSYGGVHGYAGERGDGEGRYEFTITSIGTVAPTSATDSNAGRDGRQA